MLVVIFALSAAVFAAPGKAPAKTSVKTIRAADVKAIKQVILKEQKKRGGTDVAVVDPIKIADGWAMASFYTVDKKGVKRPFDSDFLLRKKKGRWNIVSEYYNGEIAPAEANKFGLKPATAKKLGIILRVSTV